MAGKEKFLFDKDFDYEADLEAKARAEAERRAREPEPEVEPDPPAPTYSQEELAAAQDAARMDGWNAGFAAGEEQTRNHAEEALTAATTRVAAGLETLLARTGEAESRRDREALTTAVRLVEKLFPALAAREGLNEIEALLSEALHRLHEEPRVVVRVADALLDPLRHRMDAIGAKAGYPGKTILLTDDTMPEGDVRVEWADGGAERDTERLWREVGEMLARATDAPQSARPSGADRMRAPQNSEPRMPAPDPAQDGGDDAAQDGGQEARRRTA